MARRSEDSTHARNMICTLLKSGCSSAFVIIFWFFTLSNRLFYYMELPSIVNTGKIPNCSMIQRLSYQRRCCLILKLFCFPHFFSWGALECCSFIELKTICLTKKNLYPKSINCIKKQMIHYFITPLNTNYGLEYLDSEN